MPAAADATLTLLARDRWRVPVDVDRVVGCDRSVRGAVARRPRRGVVRRAEPGPAGVLVLEARRDAAGLVLEVWGPPATPSDAAAAALATTAAWVGLQDDPRVLVEVVGRHPRLRRLLHGVGEVRLPVTPRLAEAVGRAVIGQLVQAAEAARSVAQAAALLGEPAPGSLWAWPTPRRMLETPAWALRRCGVSLRAARALHAAALADRRLVEVAGDWHALDQRLRALPGVGVWTSGEVRLALGDPDAVSVGDYNLPSLVCHVLTGGNDHRDWDDDAMLALLAPFAGQRGRVIRLVQAAVAAGLARPPGRRAPRAALSAHRYW